MRAHNARRLRDYFEANRTAMTIREGLPVSILNTFLGIAMWGHEEGSREEPLTIQEISKRIGLPYTTVSRHLRYLTEIGDAHEGGMGLIVTKVWVLNQRQKTVELTPKGRQLRDQLLYILGE